MLSCNEIVSYLIKKDNVKKKMRDYTGEGGHGNFFFAADVVTGFNLHQPTLGP